MTDPAAEYAEAQARWLAAQRDGGDEPPPEPDTEPFNDGRIWNYPDGWTEG